MRLAVTHDTRYDYQPPVATARHLIHLIPPHTPRQTVRDHRLEVSPTPTVRRDEADVYGNQRSMIELDRPHDGLLVRARSLIDTSVPPLPESSMAWEAAREAFRYRAEQPYHAASEFVFPSVYVHPGDGFAAYARGCFTPGRPLIEAGRALMHQVHNEFTYRAHVTEINTPAALALQRREGVCQDFAHVMLACLRSLGLAARYVSGYLLTQPPPGMPRLVGSDASHAWVSVYLPDLPAQPGSDGPGGWYDLDPTNARDGWGTPGEDFVRLAIGRDYADVSPLRGVINGAGQHRLHVGVTVEPYEADQLPPESPAS
ncbi:transglutaminase family protein [Ottowia sp. GY511]|uniref:Transglutaminase N-terminal domain-containing protein n=1 Tax=Ottowia flava TaxID=2675430 RepID=A0ABW4KNC7_9BURK|nr:transglutaminase family protein [Ottowia sp. GY511]TXK28299.1 transglutaminase family protein [Ottowia sp. GY511]